MEAFNIHYVLSRLQENRVTIPINCNNFEETRCNTLYTSLNSNPQDCLDDMLQEVRAYRKNKFNSTSNSTVLRRNIEVHPPKQTVGSGDNRCKMLDNMKPFESLLLAIATIKDPLLSLSTNKNDRKKAVKDIHVTLKDYLSKTQVKNLDIAKYKYTKKKLKEVIDTCMEEVQYDIETLKAVVVVASRCLDLNFNIIRGHLTEHECLCNGASSTAVIVHTDNDIFKLDDIKK
jgi:hypothetical protein